MTITEKTPKQAIEGCIRKLQEITLTIESVYPAVAEQKIRQIVCRFRNFIHLCNVNEFKWNTYAKRNLNNIEAAHGCKSRDFSTPVEFVDGDCLFLFILIFFVMSTNKSQSASTVAAPEHLTGNSICKSHESVFSPCRNRKEACHE